MKTYENEFQELMDWEDRERENLEKEVRKGYNMPDDYPIDVLPFEKLNVIRQEFWAKVTELRKKYNITPNTIPADPAVVKPVSTVAKANLNYASGK